MRTIIKYYHLLCLLAAVVFAGCGEDPDPNEIRADMYFQATIDGELTTYQEEDEYINIIGDWGQGSDADGENQYIPFTCVANEAALTQAGGNARSGAIGIILTTTDNLTAQQTGEQIVSADIGFGLRSFDAADAATEGGFISWVDENGVEWTSNGTQDDGYFRIMEYTDLEAPAFFTHKVIAVEFSGKLYNGSGGVIDIEDGRCRGRLIQY